jgi:soluble lytic murein transglycosylase-like protein
VPHSGPTSHPQGLKYFSLEGYKMNLRVAACTALLAACPLTAIPAAAGQLVDANGNLDSLVSKHAAANGVPESLVRRIIKRESGGRAHVVSKGNYGIMQIKPATARGMGYRGTATGLLDADTNMTYAVKYLANAYRVAGGNPDRAVALYAGGYYYAAKRKGMLNDVDPNAGLAANAQATDTAAIPGKNPAAATATVMRTVDVANLP